MSDHKIDYDELDKAILEAQAKTNAKAAAKKTAAKSVVKPKATARPATITKKPLNAAARPVPVAKPVARPTTTPVAPVTQKPVRRSRFMDFARSKKTTVKPVAQPATIPVNKPMAKRPVAKPAAQAVATPATPRIVNHAPSAHAVAPLKSAPAHTVSPQMAAKIRQQQLLLRKRKLIEQQKKQQSIRQQLATEHTTEQKKQAAAAAKLASSATAAKATIKKQQAEAKSTPDNSNYSLGVKSPFFVNTTVQKRPLGNDIPERPSTTLPEHTKNIYSSKKDKKKKTKQEKKHTVVESPKKTSGWVWTAIVLFVLVAGGGLGYAAYIWLFTSH